LSATAVIGGPLKSKTARGVVYAALGVMFGIAFALPVPARAADVDLAGEPVVVHALTLERKFDEKIVVGEGAVELSYGDLRLRADRVIVHEDSKEVVAEGNVILDEGENRLQGEHLEINLETRTGFIEQGHGFAESYFFTGKLIEKPGFNRIRVRGGSFTTCEGDRPDWKFTSPDTLFKVDDRITTKHPAMWVKKLPVFYFPYVTLPLKKERDSGLLFPSIRINEIEGWRITNALYWAPRDNFDATLRIDWREKVGWGPGLEVRYITAPGTFGRLDSNYIDENDGGKSWSVAYNHQHALPHDIRGQVDLFVLSDRDYVLRFEDTLEMQSLEKTTSSFFLSRTWSSYDVVLSGRYEESLLTEEDSTLTRFPELTVDRTRSRIGRSDLFWRLTFEGAYLKSENVEEIFAFPVEGGEEALAGDTNVLLAQQTDIGTGRLHLAPEASWPKSLGSWGSLTPSLNYLMTHYSEDLEGESHTRLLPIASLGMDGPRLYRVFDPSAPGPLEKLKHLIEPRITYVYVPDVDQSTIPQFDLIDFIPPENTLVYSLTNTILGKIGPEEGATRARTRELLRVKLSQSYDFDALEIGGETEPFSPLGWDVRSSPTPRWDIRWKGDYNFYDTEISYQDLSLTWSSLAGAILRGEWRTAAGADLGFLDLWARVPLGAWSWDLRSRYNMDEEEFIENHAFLKYSSQCWEVSTGYVQWPGEYEFRLQIGLKGIGTVFEM
jgi:LPS-assembly protein